MVRRSGRSGTPEPRRVPREAVATVPGRPSRRARGLRRLPCKSRHSCPSVRRRDRPFDLADAVGELACLSNSPTISYRTRSCFPTGLSPRLGEPTRCRCLCSRARLFDAEIWAGSLPMARLGRRVLLRVPVLQNDRGCATAVARAGGSRPRSAQRGENPFGSVGKAR